MPPVAELIELRERIGAHVRIRRRPDVNLDDGQVHGEVAVVDHVDGSEERQNVGGERVGIAAEVKVELVVRLDANGRLLEAGDLRQIRNRIARARHGRQRRGQVFGPAGPRRRSGRVQRRVGRAHYVVPIRFVRSDIGMARARVDVRHEAVSRDPDVDAGIGLAGDNAFEVADRGKWQEGFSVLPGHRDVRVGRGDIETPEDEPARGARRRWKVVHGNLIASGRPKHRKRGGIELERLLTGRRELSRNGRRGGGPDGARDRRRGRRECGGQGHEPDQKRLESASSHISPPLEEDNQIRNLSRHPRAFARVEPRAGPMEG